MSVNTNISDECQRSTLCTNDVLVLSVDSEISHVVTCVTCCHLCMKLLPSYVSHVTAAVVVRMDKVYEQHDYSTGMFQLLTAISMLIYRKYFLL